MRNLHKQKSFVMIEKVQLLLRKTFFLNFPAKFAMVKTSLCHIAIV